MIESASRWWQNWPKTHAYVAEKMFFPASIEEISEAIKAAEAASRPVRAIGGGWSFSDAVLPGDVKTNRPSVHGVEALAAVVPQAQGYPADRSQPLVASITPMPVTDVPGSMVMLDMGQTPPTIDTRWNYFGSDRWGDPTGRVRGAPVEVGFMDWIARANLRPVRAFTAGCLDEADAPGSLAMFDLSSNSSQPSRDWFYKGSGIWIVGVFQDTRPRTDPHEGDLNDLHHAQRLSRRDGSINLTPRAADPAVSLSVLLSKAPFTPPATEPVYLINTRSLVSSLQDRLPAILGASALDQTSSTPSTGRRRYFFHVEAGITIAELGELLAHQSPRLSLQAISGSPGATLAGALATATHGAEFNWPLLIDAVKAVHLVGPGGIQWWIEGDEPIADPAKLQAAYPGLTANRIIRGNAPVGSVVPQDWLGAAVVSLGCLGVVYSVVLEAVPLFGVREVVVQKTWQNLGFLGSIYAGKNLPNLLRDPATSKDVSGRIVTLMRAGNLSGTGIPAADSQGNKVNQYADLAINPIPRADGDFDCWVANREVTAQLPLDNEPSSGILKGLANAFGPASIRKKAGEIFGLPDILADPPLWPAHLVANKGQYLGLINRIARAADTIDVGLDVLLTPLNTRVPGAYEVHQALLTGILSGLLNTANCDKRSDVTGVSVGNLGFPASGIMGVAIEIALSPSDAFGFIQTEILDLMPNRNFYGYISVRLASKTQTLLGMQQFADDVNPCSVMVEMVGFADQYAREFIQRLQKRTLQLVKSGEIDAMLHWGLENDQLDASHLAATKVLQAPSRSGMSRLSTFKAVRSLLNVAAPGAFRAFDSAFTERLGLSASSGELFFADETGTSISSWIASPYDAPPNAPLVENHPKLLRDLCLVNATSRWIRVRNVSIVSSADALGAPAFEILAPSTPFDVAFRQTVPLVPLVIQYKGTPARQITGTILVEPELGQTVAMEFSAAVVPNRHAELQITPAQLEFGDTRVGTEVALYLSIANTGSKTATLERIVVQSAVPRPELPGFGAGAARNLAALREPENRIDIPLVQPSPHFSLPFVLPGAVPPGESRTVSVAFNPTTRGLAHATLVISVRSQTDIASVEFSRSYEVVLSGTGHAPQMLLAATSQSTAAITSLDFGAAAPSTIDTASFWVRNVGDAPLLVEGVQVPTGSLFDFPDATIFPATVAPGNALEVPCVFAVPATPGTAAMGVLRVLTDDARQMSNTGLGDLIMKGRAEGAHLSDPPEVLMLGNTPPLQVTANLVFRSDGTLAVNVRKITLSHANDFSVGNVGPIQLAPGSNLTVTVTLTATQPGFYQNRFFVEHDGNPDRRSEVNLAGTVA
jgi:hypothetical protein